MAADLKSMYSFSTCNCHNLYSQGFKVPSQLSLLVQDKIFDCGSR